MSLSESRVPRVIAIVGPTAVGKSRLAFELAAMYPADIVSADSRQVYRYMDIGTAKPSRIEQAQVTHYMIDLVPPDEGFSAARFREEGRRVLTRISEKGRIPLVVGGTGFYVRALLDGIHLPAVPPDAALREELRTEASTHGPEVLHQRLAAADPRSADRIHPRNAPRIIRALEIVRHLDGPVPEPRSGESIETLYLGLTIPRDILHTRADIRARDQIETGLVEETRFLLCMGYSPQLDPLRSFGYQQMVAHLQENLPIELALEQYQAATRQYIRRQTTWFRSDPRIQWLDAEESPIQEARAAIDEWLAR